MSNPYLRSDSNDENSILSPSSARTAGSQGTTPRDDRFNTPRMYTARSNSTDEFTSPRQWSENGSDYGTPRQGQYPTPRGGPNSARGGPSPRIQSSPRQQPSPRQYYYGDDPNNMQQHYQQQHYQQQQYYRGAGAPKGPASNQQYVQQPPPPHNNNMDGGGGDGYFQNSFAMQQQQHQQVGYGQPVQMNSLQYYGTDQQQNQYSPMQQQGQSQQQYPTLRDQHMYDSQYKQFDGGVGAGAKDDGAYAPYGYGHPPPDSKQQYHHPGVDGGLQQQQQQQQAHVTSAPPQYSQQQHHQQYAQQQPQQQQQQQQRPPIYQADAKQSYDGGGYVSPVKGEQDVYMDPELEYRRHMQQQQQQLQGPPPTIKEGGEGEDMSEVEAALEQVYAAGMTDQDVDDMFSFARHGRVDEIDRLLDGGIPVDVRDAHGNTLLTTACQNGNKRVAKCVLRRAANINSRNNKGNTPLHYCFSYGYGETLGQYLIDKGADVRARNLAGKGIYDGI